MGYRAARAAWVRLDLLVEALCTRGRWQRRTRRRRGHGASARSSPTWRWLRAAAQKRAASTRPRRAARWPRALQGELEGGVSRARAAVRTGRARLETRGAAGAAPAAQPSRASRQGHPARDHHHELDPGAQQMAQRGRHHLLEEVQRQTAQQKSASGRWVGAGVRSGCAHVQLWRRAPPPLGSAALAV